MILQTVVYYLLLEFATAISDGEYFSFPCSEDSKEVAACTHRYLEKDFSSISPYIYGKRQEEMRDKCSSRVDSQNQANAGQEFEENCNHLYEVIHCLEKELIVCQSISSFFMLRNLVYTLNKMIFLLCGSQRSSEGYVSETEAMINRDNQLRLRMLLNSLECLECLRTSNSPNECDSSDVVKDRHLWKQIIRLEKTPAEVCPDLKKQIHCITSKQIALKHCDKNAHEIYVNLTNAFVGAWCNKNSLLSSGGHFSPNKFLLLYIITHWTFGLFYYTFIKYWLL